MIYVTLEPNSVIAFDNSPTLFRKWLEENDIEPRSWYNSVGNTNIFGFELKSEEDYMAIKLRWG